MYPTCISFGIRPIFQDVQIYTLQVKVKPPYTLKNIKKWNNFC